MYSRRFDYVAIRFLDTVDVLFLLLFLYYIFRGVFMLT